MELGATDRAQLQSFANDYLRYGHGPLTLETPSGGANSDSASVLAADTPEMRELFGTPEVLFDIQDSESLARALSVLRRDPAHRTRIANLTQARAKVFAFDWNARACELIE